MLTEPIPFAEALRYLADKAVLPTNATSAEIAGWGADIRKRSFFSAQNLLTDLLDKQKDAVQQILNPQPAFGGTGINDVTVGLDLPTARLQIKELIRGLDYTPAPEDAGTIKDLGSDARINLVVETNVQSAQGYGAFRQGQDEAVLDEYPAQELYRLDNADEPRDWLQIWRGLGGELHEGRMIALKDAPIWDELGNSDDGLHQPWPPYRFNSGMWTKPVSRDEAMRLGLIDRDTQIRPDPRGFAMEVA